MPTHDSLESHNGVGFQNELFPLLVGVFWVQAWVVQALVLVQRDFGLLSKLLRL